MAISYSSNDKSCSIAKTLHRNAHSLDLDGVLSSVLDCLCYPNHIKHLRYIVYAED